VLAVMVGEGIQEMQLAGWLPTTDTGWTSRAGWATWFVLFPTAETLAAEAVAAALVIGSDFAAEY
jgi:high-affinity iron transporter